METPFLYIDILSLPPAFSYNRLIRDNHFFAIGQIGEIYEKT